MKIRYTPGTPEGLVGKTYTVEILRIRVIQNKRIGYPLLQEVLIKYKEDGRTEWITGNKLLSSIANLSKGAVDMIID